MNRALARLRGLILRRAEKGFDEELELHLRLLAERFERQGMTPAQAESAARRQFGNCTQLKEVRKEMGSIVSLESFWQDIRFGARALRRSPGVTGVIILTLMLGIGANAALFSVIYAVLLRPLPFHDPGRLVMLSERRFQAAPDVVSAVDFEFWRTHARSFESMAAFSNLADSIQIGGRTVTAGMVFAMEDLLAVLGVPPVVGRGFLTEEVRPTPGGPPRHVAIISHRFFEQQLGGDTAAIGREVVVFRNTPYLIAGVLPRDFRFAPPELRAGIPLETDVIVDAGWDPARTQRAGPRAAPGFMVLGRLRAGVAAATAQAELETVRVALRAVGLPPGGRDGVLRMVPLHEYLVVSARQILMVLWGAAGFVLLVACVNVANLLLSRSVARGRETAVRAALGAGRGRLIRQLLTESVILAGAGGIAGLALAYWITRLLVTRSPIDLPRLKDAGLNWPVLLFCAAMCGLTGILSGLAPALAGSRSSLAEVIKEGGRAASGARRARMRGLLVVSELAFALVLLSGAGLMLKGLWVIRTQTAAFSPEQVLVAGLNAREATLDDRDEYFGELMQQIEALPAVRAAAMQQPAGSPLRVVGMAAPPPDKDVVTSEFRVTPHFLRAAGLRLIAGRWLTDSDIDGAPRVTVINETVQRWFRATYPGSGSPIGRQIGFQPPFFTVVGVVSDFRAQPDAEPQPQVYVSWRQWSLNGLGTMMVRTESDPMALAGSIRKIIQRTPRVSVSAMRTLEEQFSSAIASRRVESALLATFAGLALLLAMVGAYGALSYAVTERTNEIGVRMALGAGKPEVLRMVLGRAARLVVGGLAVGLIAAVNLTRLMRGLLYGVTPADPWTYVAVSLLLAGVGLFAAWLPARRAARVDPVVALRYE